MSETPFAVLGLPARAGLTDDDVRAAWRRLAAATHPDRADGGDPERFAAAAAAYTTLRTKSGRGEALADLTAPAPPPRPAPRPSRSARTPPPAPTDQASRPAHADHASRPAPADQASRPGPGDRPRPGRASTGARAERAGTWAGRLVGRIRGLTWAGRLVGRVRRGRPGRLLLRVVIAVAVSLGAVAVAGAQPATPALIVGAVTWLLLTSPRDLAPPP